MMMQDLNTIQEPESDQMPRFPQKSVHGLEDSVERAAGIGHFFGDIALVGTQEYGKGKRNNLIDGNENLSAVSKISSYG